MNYCSYVIKSANLNKNMDGEYGITVSLEKAIFVDLEESEYKAKLRTAIVVYNGNDGNRSDSGKFEKIKKDILERAINKGILLRGIEKWDLSYFSKLLFPYQNDLRKKEYFKNSISMMSESTKLINSIKTNFPRFGIDENNPNSPMEEFLVGLNEDIIHLEDKYGPIQIIKEI